MRIGVVSDTHGHREYTMNGVRLLESLEVEVVLHCGDIGSPEIPACFQQWPTHFVLGNVDHPVQPLEQAIAAAGLTFHGRFASLNLAGVRIAILHSDDEQRFRQTIASGDFDLICFGHTHKAEQRREGNSLLLNPGALFRATPHSIAIVDLPELAVTHITV